MIHLYDTVDYLPLFNKRILFRLLEFTPRLSLTTRKYSFIILENYG